MSSQTVRDWGLSLLSVASRLLLGPSRGPSSEGPTPARPPLELPHGLRGPSHPALPGECWRLGWSLPGCLWQWGRAAVLLGGVASRGRVLATADAGARAMEVLCGGGHPGPGQLQWGGTVLNVGTKMGSVTLLHGVRKTAEPEVSRQFRKGTLVRSPFSHSRNSPVKTQPYMASGTVTSSEPRPSWERHFKTSLADRFRPDVTCR